jgi:GH24 family phage-related lysozyme (muramidase)
MRPAVASIFVRFSQTYEGNIPWPYADCLGKITVGIGQLCDTPAEFRSLPWKSHIGPATSDEIQHAYEELRAAAAYMSGHSAAGYEAVKSAAGTGHNRRIMLR